MTLYGSVPTAVTLDQLNQSLFIHILHLSIATPRLNTASLLSLSLSLHSPFLCNLSLYISFNLLLFSPAHTLPLRPCQPSTPFSTQKLFFCIPSLSPSLSVSLPPHLSLSLPLSLSLSPQR